jgi:hypothetical protein
LLSDTILTQSVKKVNAHFNKYDRFKKKRLSRRETAFFIGLSNLMITAATKYNDNSEYDNPRAVIVKDVA